MRRCSALMLRPRAAPSCATAARDAPLEHRSAASSPKPAPPRKRPRRRLRRPTRTTAQAAAVDACVDWPLRAARPPTHHRAAGVNTDRGTLLASHSGPRSVRARGRHESALPPLRRTNKPPHRRRPPACAAPLSCSLHGANTSRFRQIAAFRLGSTRAGRDDLDPARRQARRHWTSRRSRRPASRELRCHENRPVTSRKAAPKKNDRPLNSRKHAPKGTTAICGTTPETQKAAPEGTAVARKLNRRRPTLPGPCGPSTIGAVGLDCSVRNGKRYFPHAVTTGKC